MGGAAKRIGVCIAAAALALAILPAAAGAWWRPPAKLTFYWQLQGPLKRTASAGVYDVDGFETSAREVAALKAQGRHVVCYIDVGTAEKFRPDYGAFPRSVLGRPNGWPGEKWLDIRRLAIIEPIMAARLQMCRVKGFEALEPDNIEAASVHSGFPITAQDQLTFNEWVAGEAHSLGMAVLQKNDGAQAAALEPFFDGVLTEQCNQYRECSNYGPYLKAGKPVIDAEYKLKTSRFCKADAAAGIIGARFGLALDGKRFEPCW